MSEADPFSNGEHRGEEHELNYRISRYVDRLNAGEKLDPQQVLKDHPVNGDRILEELQVFLDLGEDKFHDAFITQDPLGTLGDYTLRRQIGRGGMGVVYEAWQNSVDRRVALKVLPAGIAADNKAFMRFMREARAAAQLNHRNVVAVYGMGQEEKAPYFAMLTGQSPRTLPPLRR